MDRLKDFITTNRAAFDAEAPLPLGHEARFLSRLEATEAAPAPQVGAVRWMRYGLLVASLAAAVALLLLLRSGGEGAAEPEDPFLAEVRQTESEMAELQSYYHMQMHDVREQMKQLAERQPSPGVMAIWQESERILADNRSFEQNELPQLPAEGETLYTLTQHYGNSLETLQFMLSKMEQMSETNERIN